MSNKIFHWTSTFKTLGEDDDGSVNIKGYASTNALDRAGDVVDHDAWNKSGGLENFKTNPIILFNHDYNKPIGRATTMDVTERGLELGARISKSAGEIKDLIKDGSYAVDTPKDLDRCSVYTLQIFDKYVRT